MDGVREELDVYDTGTGKDFSIGIGEALCLALGLIRVLRGRAMRRCTIFREKALYCKKMVYSTSVKYQELRSTQLLQAMLCVKGS